MVNGVDYNLEDVDVLLFIETSNVISVSDISLMEDNVYGTGMVLNIQPTSSRARSHPYHKQATACGGTCC